MLVKIEKTYMGNIEGRKVNSYTLSNDSNTVVKILNYGGIITSIFTPDRDGNIIDVVLGYDELEDYVEDNFYFGAIIGRYGNRIAEGKLQLEGTNINLSINNPPNHLHGGVNGFNKVVWDANEIINEDEIGVELSYVSKDGEEGYPGNLSVTVVYTLTNDNEIKINYSANTDKTTVCNLTNHSYFNLNDGGATDILDHELIINAEYFLDTNSSLIPTGEMLKVKNTPFDFRVANKIGDRINENNEQIKYANGYDHNYIISKNNGELCLAAEAKETKSGRILRIYTDQPGIQFYTGNFLNGTKNGKKGVLYKQRNGFCLETQHFPDSPNKLNFPSTVLNKDEIYSSTTIFKFSVEK